MADDVFRQLVGSMQSFEQDNALQDVVQNEPYFRDWAAGLGVLGDSFNRGAGIVGDAARDIGSTLIDRDFINGLKEMLIGTSGSKELNLGLLGATPATFIAKQALDKMNSIQEDKPVMRDTRYEDLHARNLETILRKQQEANAARDAEDAKKVEEVFSALSKGKSNEMYVAKGDNIYSRGAPENSTGNFSEYKSIPTEREKEQARQINSLRQIGVPDEQILSMVTAATTENPVIQRYLLDPRNAVKSKESQIEEVIRAAFKGGDSVDGAEKARYMLRAIMGLSDKEIDAILGVVPKEQ